MGVGIVYSGLYIFYFLEQQHWKATPLLIFLIDLFLFFFVTKKIESYIIN